MEPELPRLIFLEMACLAPSAPPKSTKIRPPKVYPWQVKLRKNETLRTKTSCANAVASI